MEQRTEEWFATRLGKCTASRVSDVMAKTNKGWGAGRVNYMTELIVERLTGQKGDNYINGAMQWGIDTEPEAKIAYSHDTLEDIEDVGFVDHPKIPMFGASPDGLVGEDGIVEIKCPNTNTHIDYVLKGKVPSKYVKQIQTQLACTDRKWCDFVSYDPRLPENLQLFVVRVERDDEKISEIEGAVKDFLKELDSRLVDLREIGM